MDTAFSRHLPWEGCYNIRDIGGYATSDGGLTRWRALVRADSICRLTPAGRAALADYGVRTIIDLRFDYELAANPNPFADPAARAPGFSYHHLPLRDQSDPTITEAIRAADSLQAQYCLVLDYGQAHIAAIVRAIAQAPEGGVLLHCHVGKDRTGLIIALLLALAGVPATTIAEDYALSAGYLQPLYNRRMEQLQSPAERERVARDWVAPPATMLATLEYLDIRHQGVESYLRAGGLSSEHVEHLRERLVQTNPT